MNFYLIALLIIFFPFDVFSQETNPTIYGRLDLRFEHTRHGKADKMKKFTHVSSHSSYLGLKGENKMSESSLKAIFQIEYEVNADIETTDNLKNRNTYVGIQGWGGTVLLGHHDNLIKRSSGKFDLFNEDLGGLEELTPAGKRLKNSLTYHSPEFFGLQISLSAQPDEQPEAQQTGSIFSTSAIFNSNGIFLGLSKQVDMVSEEDLTRLTFIYTQNQWQFGVLYQLAKDGTIGDVYQNEDHVADTQGISVSYRFGDLMLRAQHLNSEELITKGSSRSLGIDYLFSEQTKTYLLGTEIDGLYETDRKSTAAIGLQHHF